MLRDILVSVTTTLPFKLTVDVNGILMDASLVHDFKFSPCFRVK